MAPSIIALEIGTSKVCALAGESRDDDHIVITGKGQCVSCGMRKGMVTDMAKVSECVRTVLHNVEEIADCTAREVYLVLNGGHIQGTLNRVSIPVMTPDRIITQDDIQQITGMAKAIPLPPERKALHYCSRKFYIDDHSAVTNPKDMQGNKLSLDMFIIHGETNLMSNVANVVLKLNVEVADAAFGGLCAALATLTEEQKERGALVIELGGGTTSYMAYADGVVAAGGAVGVGGDHVSNDIALAFNLSLRRAELLKYEYGAATLSSADCAAQIQVQDELGFPGGAIALSSLNTVINARMRELFEIILHEIKTHGVQPQMLGAGLVLTGGGARLKGAPALAEEIFQLPCDIGRPRNIGGPTAMYDAPEYAAPVGMLRYALQEREKHELYGSIGLTRGLRNIIRKFF